MSKKSWSDLSPRQQQLIMAAGVAEFVLTSAALLDLRRRGPADVRGPKWAWRAASFVQPVGPIAYFVWGRRPA